VQHEARARYDTRRNTRHRGPVRNIVEHHRHCADLAIVSDTNIPQHLRVSAELDVIAHSRDTSSFVPIADGDALPQGAIGADPRGSMNEDVAEMPDAQAWTYSDRFRQADPRQRLDNPEAQPVHLRQNPGTRTCRV